MSCCRHAFCRCACFSRSLASFSKSSSALGSLASVSTRRGRVAMSRRRRAYGSPGKGLAERALPEAELRHGVSRGGVEKTGCRGAAEQRAADAVAHHGGGGIALGHRRNGGLAILLTLLL